MRREIFLLIAIVVAAAYFEGRATSSGAATDTKNMSKAANLPDHVKIAFVDVAKIFKGHTAYKAKMDKMKEKVDSEEAKVAANTKRLEGMAENLKDPTVDLDTADRIRQEILQSQKLGAAEIELKKAQFMREEGRIYYDTINDVREIIQRCCERNGIQVVIRFNGDPVDPNSREDVLRAINGPIPYFDPAMDITDEIIAEVNSQTKE